MRQRTITTYILGLAGLTFVFGLAAMFAMGTGDPKPTQIAFSRRPEATELKPFHHVSLTQDGTGKIRQFNNVSTTSQVNDTLFVIEQSTDADIATLTCPADAGSNGLSFEVENDTLYVRLTLDSPKPDGSIEFSTLSPIVVTMPATVQLKSVTATPSFDVFTILKNITTPELSANLSRATQLTDCNIGNLHVNPISAGDDSDDENDIYTVVDVSRHYGIDIAPNQTELNLSLNGSAIDSMTIAFGRPGYVKLGNSAAKANNRISSIGALDVTNVSDSTFMAAFAVGRVKVGSLSIAPTITCDTEFTTTTTTRLTVGKECNPQNLRK